MQTLILPGYSSSNKEWVDDVTKNLKAEAIMLPTDVIRPFYWMHWTDEAQKFNTTEKAELIAKHIRGDKVNIIAKDEGLEIANILKSIIPDQIISIN